MVAIYDEAEARVVMTWRHRFASDVWNWELVGGVAELGEHPAETARREAREEGG
jgi:8-oxo-dGTP pyrophosphatase MutT (NUDIX family)